MQFTAYDILEEIEPVAVFVRRVGNLYEVTVEGSFGEEDIAAVTANHEEAERHANLLGRLYRI